MSQLVRMRTRLPGLWLVARCCHARLRPSSRRCAHVTTLAVGLQLSRQHRARMQTHKPVAERGCGRWRARAAWSTRAHSQRPTRALRTHSTRRADSPGSQEGGEEGAVPRDVRIGSRHVVAARVRDRVPAVRREQAGQRLAVGERDLRSRRRARLGYGTSV